MNSNRSKRRIVVPAALAALLLGASAAAGAAERLASGQWESVMTTDGAARTAKYCVDPAEAASMNGDSQSGRDYAEKKNQKTGGRCSIKSFAIKGNTVSYSLLCGDRSIENTQTYRGDTSEGVITTTVQGQPAVTTRIKSRRIGNC